MNSQLVDGWWLITDGALGSSDTSHVTEKQIVNATNVYRYLSSYGWTLSAIAGILGNMHHESYLSPAYIQDTNRWRLPNHAENLSDVPNSVMQNFYKEYYGVSSRAFGIGLVQWDGKGITRQKLVGFSMNNGLVWYNGETQCLRLKDEHDGDKQWQKRTLYGIRWTWDLYVNNTRSPEDSAHIWRICYEVGGDKSDATRQANARYWYNYFEDTPPGPGPEPPEPPEPDPYWISGTTFASSALAYDGQYIPYSQMDCIGFVNDVWKHISAYTASDNLTNGTNSIWRSNRTFDTTSPIGIKPTPELYYKSTIAECVEMYGEIPPGALLFHRISEEGPPAIPPQYAGDGIGNFVHVGIYCGNDEVMQSGGRDSASVPGGGVHKSAYDPQAWNYVAFVVYVNCLGSEPPEPPEPQFPFWLLFDFKKKDVKKNVRR